MQPLEKQNLHKTLVDHLVNAILEDEILCGEKLESEVELAETLGVSRNMLREAMKTMEIFGIIESRHGRGTYIAENAKQLVANIGFMQALAKNQSVQSLLEARIVIEPGLAQFAAMRRTDVDIDEMRSLVASPLDQERNCLTPLFHLSIAKAAKCEVLEKYLESILAQLRFTEYYEIQGKMSPQFLEHEVDEHQRILDRIVENDPEGARQYTYTHLHSLYQVILSLNEKT